MTGHACTEKSCIFCALKVVFTQFQFSHHSTLIPDSLRRALAAAFRKSHRFQIGFMDDATECFETILRWLHFHLVYSVPFDSCTAAHCISHSKFGMTLTEQAVCILCGAKTRSLTFTELVHYVPATAILRVRETLQNQPRPNIGNILRVALDSEVLSCPVGCGGVVQLNHTLINTPDVITVGLVWDTDRASADEVSQLTSIMCSSLRPSDLFLSSPSFEFSLAGIVCYYCKHYSTFLFDRRKGIWILCDDATVVTIGSSWSNVADKICIGHFQPLLFFFENPNSDPVVMATAPSTTSFVPTPTDISGNEEGDCKNQIMDRVGGNRKDAKGNIFVDGSTNSLGNSFEDVSHKTKSIIPITIFSAEKGIRRGFELKTGPFHSSFDSSDCERFHEVRGSNVAKYGPRTESLLKLQEVFRSVHSTKSQCLSNFSTKKESYLNRTSEAQCRPTRSDCVPLTCNINDNETGYPSLISRMSSENRPTECRVRYESSEFFSKNIWNGGKICPGKRSSYACPHQSASAFDKFSFHDDQSFPSFSSSLPSTKWRTELNTDSRVSFAPIEWNSRLFESTGMADDVHQGSYICAETVRSVLVARGLKIHGKRVEGPHRRIANMETWPPLPNAAHELSSSPRRVCVVGSDEAESGKNNELKALDESESSTTGSANQRKGILANRRRNKKKRVSFSDSVALVLSAEDVPPLQPLNYVGRSPLPPLSSGSNPADLLLRFSSLSSNGSGDSAYSSLSESASLSSESPDFSGGGTAEVRTVNEVCETENDDDDDDDHQILEEEEDVDSNDSRQIRCGLCCRKWIRAPGIYCHDCRIYMTRLDCSGPTSDGHC